MKVVIETYVSVFVICICVVLCACLITADINVASARDAYTTYVLELQDSNFADDVVQACLDDATSRGYSINITVYDNGGGDRSGNIELQYDYSIGLIGYTTQRYIRGYVS